MKAERNQASLVAQLVKNPPAMLVTWVRSLGWVGKIPWRRKWQPTPVLLPGESHGGRSLVGYSPWGHKELDTTELLHSWWLQSSVTVPCHPPPLKSPLANRLFWSTAESGLGYCFRFPHYNYLLHCFPLLTWLIKRIFQFISQFSYSGIKDILQIRK